MRLVWAVLLVLTVWLLVNAARPPMELTLSPTVCQAPCWLRAKVRVYEPQPGDIVRVIADSDNEYHASNINIEPNRTMYELPPWVFKIPGDYQIVAILAHCRGDDEHCADTGYRVVKELQVH